MSQVRRHVEPWVYLELSNARDQLDEAEQLLDGSERLMALIDSASEIEKRVTNILNR